MPHSKKVQLFKIQLRWLQRHLLLFPPPKGDDVMETNWDEIKIDYIANNLSLRKLAEKYGLSKDAINKHSKKENWLRERQKLKTATQTKLRQKLSTRRATKIAKELIAAEEAAAELIETAKEILGDKKQFYRHLVKIREGDKYGFEERLEDKEYEIADTKRFKDLAAGLEIAARLSRTLKGIIDEPVKQKLDIERERLEIERTKAGLSGDDKEETGVVEIPAYVEVNPEEGIELGTLDLDTPDPGGKKNG